MTAVAAPLAPTTVTPTAPVREDDDHGRSRAGMWFLVGLLLVLLIGAAAYLLPRMFESPPEQDQVPDLIGMREREARNTLGAAGFSVQVDYRTDENADEGTVIEQDPNPDQYVAPGSEVTIVVSEGAPLVDVPYVLDIPREQARAQLEERGFEVRFEPRESDDPRNQVVATDPTPGTPVPEGSTVTVFFSDGPEEIPSVVGEQQEDAERILTEAGFEVDVVESSDTTEPKGTVIRQSPEGGETASAGSTVTIVVSSFEEEEEPTESPSPTETPTETPGLPTDSPAARPTED